MPKLGSNKFDKECPICGGIIWGRGQRVLLEGTKITVCQNCAQHGIILHEPLLNRSKTHTHYSIKARPSKRKGIKKTLIDDLEIVPEFAKKIKNVRNLLGLNQDQFAQKLNEKPSLLRRIETGKVEPTIKLAKKIQEVYNIILLQKSDDSIEAKVRDSKYMKKSSRTSLGDLAFIKKKK
ncbi:hypothetical protein LCGC14_1145020 [marine sediment metagenome]|uniref:HTH cro/C1-type domain-containing protein n=1 Tax=marine sediment metagenome TaxID=412755 RepID=A0A0F9M1X4_9ZZZZ